MATKDEETVTKNWEELLTRAFSLKVSAPNHLSSVKINLKKAKQYLQKNIIKYQYMHYVTEKKQQKMVPLSTLAAILRQAELKKDILVQIFFARFFLQKLIDLKTNSTPNLSFL